MIGCPKCNSKNVRVEGYCKYIEDSNIYSRTKICKDCKYQFKTVEANQEDYIEATELASAIVNLIKKHLYSEEIKA